jgi:hypothetical protein
MGQGYAILEGSSNSDRKPQLAARRNSTIYLRLDWLWKYFPGVTPVA